MVYGGEIAAPHHLADCRRADSYPADRHPVYHFHRKTMRHPKLPEERRIPAPPRTEYKLRPDAYHAEMHPGEKAIHNECRCIFPPHLPTEREDDANVEPRLIQEPDPVFERCQHEERLLPAEHLARMRMKCEQHRGTPHAPRFEDERLDHFSVPQVNAIEDPHRQHDGGRVTHLPGIKTADNLHTTPTTVSTAE
jgi:hypothetical protein